MCSFRNLDMDQEAILQGLGLGANQQRAHTARHEVQFRRFCSYRILLGFRCLGFFGWVEQVPTLAGVDPLRDVESEERVSRVLVGG